MERKVNYRFTNNYDTALPDCGFEPELQTEIFEDEYYTFQDFLSDNGVEFEEENEMFFVTVDGERTGQVYAIM